MINNNHLLITIAGQAEKGFSSRFKGLTVAISVQNSLLLEEIRLVAQKNGLLKKESTVWMHSKETGLYVLEFGAVGFIFSLFEIQLMEMLQQRFKAAFLSRAVAIMHEHRSVDLLFAYPSEYKSV
jgi:hypothetical protein